MSIKILLVAGWTSVRTTVNAAWVGKYSLPILIVFAICTGIYFILNPIPVSNQTDSINRFSDFPIGTLKASQTHIVELSITENVDNAVIAPSEIVLGGGNIIIGVIDGFIGIKEPNGVRPSHPFNFLDFKLVSGKDERFAKLTGLSEIVTKKGEVLSISFRKGLEKEILYSLNKKNNKNVFGKVIIGIHYSETPLGLGKAPKFEDKAEFFSGVVSVERIVGSIKKISENSKSVTLPYVPPTESNELAKEMKNSLEEKSSSFGNWFNDRKKEVTGGYQPKAKNYIMSEEDKNQAVKQSYETPMTDSPENGSLQSTVFIDDEGGEVGPGPLVFKGPVR